MKIIPFIELQQKAEEQRRLMEEQENLDKAKLKAQEEENPNKDETNSKPETVLTETQNMTDTKSDSESKDMKSESQEGELVYTRKQENEERMSILQEAGDGAAGGGARPKISSSHREQPQTEQGDYYNYLLETQGKL